MKKIRAKPNQAPMKVDKGLFSEQIQKE